MCPSCVRRPDVAFTVLPFASPNTRRPYMALCFAGALGCATYSERTEEARAALLRGEYETSVGQLNAALKVKKNEDFPAKLKKNHELVILERATVLQAMGAYQASAKNFEFADKQLEFLDISRDTAGKVAKYIYSDSATRYRTSPTEKLALNAMNLCNYLAQGDLRGAKVEAKRFTVMRTYLRDYGPKGEHGAFGSYLAGYVYERRGDANAALRYYEEALAQRDFRTLREVLPGLAARGSYRGERIVEYLPADSAAPAAGSSLDGEVLVVAKVGRVPYKVPKRIPIGLAVGLAGAYVTGDVTLLEYGMFKFVVYPELTPAQNVFERARVQIDGDPIPVDLASDLAEEIRTEYERHKPKIIGAALTRMVARAAAAEGARAAGKQADGAGALVGFLAAAAVEGAMVALDKPDTRSWTTLPAQVFVGRSRVPAGAHTVTVELSGSGGRQESKKVEVKVPAGGSVVLDVTTLR